MTSILSTLILTLFVVFAISINTKAGELKVAGYKDIALDLKEGAICGRLEKTWACFNIYEFNLEGDEK